MEERATRRTERRRGDALAGDWGWANKETRLALPRHEDGLGLGSGSPELHKNDGRHSGSNGRCRVHDDAQRAVVRVIGIGMEVGNLSYGEQRQQDKANRGNSRE